MQGRPFLRTPSYHSVMKFRLRATVFVLMLSAASLTGCTPQPQESVPVELRVVTLLYTNDFESAYDPIPAFWRDDLDHVGGIAELATLIDQVRAKGELTFLLDAGD